MNKPSPSSSIVSRFANLSVKLSSRLCFLTIAAGQLAFVYYILVAYVPRTLGGAFERWDETGLIMGHEAGDGFGNFMFITHVLLAAVMTLAGLMQLTPPIRKTFPAFHRMTGRVFLVLAVYLAVGGIWMVWGRGARLNDVLGFASLIECVLILTFATMTVRYAVKRQIGRHHEWALRLFMAASGVWFIRVFYSAWFLTTDGIGVTRSMDGWYDYVAGFGAVLIPLAVLELYRQAQTRSSIALKLTASGVVLVGAGVIVLGSVGASLIMWGPHL